MKSNLEKYVEQVIKGFQLHKGRASVYCFPPISFAEVVLAIVSQFHERTPEAQVFIVVAEFKYRQSVLERLRKDEAERGIVYNVKVLSADYVQTKYKYDYRLIITIGVNDDLGLLSFLAGQGKFVLTMLTKNIMDNQFITKLREILPPIEVTVSGNSVAADIIYSPVEEHRIGINIDNEDRALYDKCTEYISTSVAIFGDMSNIEKCKIGDVKLNIGAAEVRESIAKENGWSNTLDTSIEWNKKIDDIYNPNILLERAVTFYNIVKQRRDIVMDNVLKLAEIWKICYEHQGKKILIVSKRGEFAASITKYINEVGEFICADYHDTIEPKEAVDAYGVPLLTKSGKNKGQPRVVGAQAISTANMNAFNNNAVNVLSIKNSSNNKLKIDVDVVIYTTPFIDDIFTLKTRFTDVRFNGADTLNYKVYCINTIEHKHLAGQKESRLITVVDADDENDISFDEISGAEIW